MAGSPASITNPQDIRRSTLEIAEQLNVFCATHTYQPKALNLEADLIDLQLSVCRKLRELLPTSNCAALLKTAQTQRWIPVLLQWLNLHDRPAVQVESLLAVTNIAEVCAHQYPKHGNVPFPPLSFSQSLSKEAIQALDASLTEKAVPPYATPPPTSSGSSSTTAFVPPPTPCLTSFPQQNLSTGVQQLLLRHAEAIPALIGLLSSPQAEIYEQALWILGSIAAGDNNPHQEKSGLSSRDVVLTKGIWPRLLCCLQRHPRNLSLQRIGSWTLSNLLDQLFPSSGSNSSNNNNNNSSNNSPSTDLTDEIDMETLFPVLERLLNMTDSEVLSYTCWSLSHLCDSAPHIGAVVAAGLAPRLVELLLHASWRVTKPALRTIGNIVCAEASNEEDFTEVILECEAVPRLKELIGHANKEIQKEACWTLSNISAGTVNQINAVIESGAIPVLVDLVRNPATDQEVKSEACWVVLNATSCGSDAQIEVLVTEGCVAVLGLLLAESSMVMMALEGLERVLQVEEASEHQPPLTLTITAALIEKAREPHNSSAVTKRADKIWKQHFVSCALCKQSFSRHRTAEASFCEECKCHVCANCDCSIYHMDYVERELWLSSEKPETNKTRKNKKNKKKKKKKAQELAKEKKEEEEEKTTAVSPPEDEEAEEDVQVKKVEERSTSPSPVEAENQIDLVLYLQQTGSIIALSKLMDALECDEEDLDDYERKTISDIREASYQQSV